MWSVFKVILAMEVAGWVMVLAVAWAQSKGLVHLAGETCPTFTWPLWLVVLLGPVLETFLVVGLASMLAPRITNLVVLSGISALVWGALHFNGFHLGFLNPYWAFFIMTAAFLTWRPRSFWLGWAAAAIPHLVHDVLWYVVAHLGSP